MLSSRLFVLVLAPVSGVWFASTGFIAAPRPLVSELGNLCTMCEEQQDEPLLGATGTAARACAGCLELAVAVIEERDDVPRQQQDAYEAACSFCGVERDSRTKVVVAPSANVCEQCARAALAVRNALTG